MRRAILLAAAAAAATMMTPPAEAATIRLTHSAPLPCSVVCAYWDGPAAAGFDPCSAPFPEGSYDRTVLRMTSTRGIVHIVATSGVDYDTFICTNTQPPVLVAQLANSIGDNCQGVAGRSAVPVGCVESGDLTYRGLLAANGGVNARQWILISYNWSDNGVLPIKITGPAAVLNDRFDPTCPANAC